MKLKSYVKCDLCGEKITMPKAIIEYIEGHVYVRHKECKRSKVTNIHSMLDVEKELYLDTNCIMKYLNKICKHNPRSAPLCAELVVKIFE